jgi:hypothetical protein
MKFAEMFFLLMGDGRSMEKQIRLF